VPRTEERDTSDLIVDLNVADSSEKLTLRQVLDMENDSEVMDSVQIGVPCCVCGTLSTHTLTAGVVDAAELLLIGINRSTAAKAQGDSFATRKLNTYVGANPVLEIGGLHYRLVSVVEHIGDSCESGHYITHACLDGLYWAVYNDDHVSIMPGLSESACRGSRLYVYELWDPECARDDESAEGAEELGASSDNGDDASTEGAEEFGASTDNTVGVGTGQTGTESGSSDVTSAVQGTGVLMDAEYGQERLDRDVAELLRIFEMGGDVRTYLSRLPLFVSGAYLEKSLDRISHEFDVAISSLVEDKVNSHAALFVRPYYADSVVYPFCVLMEATGRATAIPPVFFLDTATTLIHSILHKHSYLLMGRWKSRSRHWWNGVALIGEGKSMSMKAFTDDMVDTLREFSAFAVGSAEDRFHYQQSGTTASAVDKLRAAEAYLTVYCSDAGRCLSKAAAVGHAVDPHKHVDLEFFLDAAHGDEFNHSTLTARQKVLKKAVQNPQEPVRPPQTLHMDPTNVHIMLLQQELFFQVYWAQIARKHPVGLPQRCLFAFGGDMDPAPKKWNDFFERVTRPIIRDLFRQIVRRIGPKITGVEVPVFETTDGQNEVVSELEQLLKLYQRRLTLGDELKAALPKSLYWLGTACLSNHIIGQYWVPALMKVDPPPELRRDVPNITFLSAVSFIYRRYLPGQCVLGVTAQEEAWLGRELPYETNPDDLTPEVVRILRGSPGGIISRGTIEQLDLALKRSLQRKESHEYKTALQKLERLWRLLFDVGVGRLMQDTSGETYLHKFRRDSLSQPALTWLQEQRVPGYLFGIAPKGLSRDREAPAAVPMRIGDFQGALSPQLFKGDGRADPGDSKTFGAPLPATAADGSVEVASAAAEAADGNVEVGTAAASKATPVKTLCSEVVDGILLTQQACRERLRKHLRELNEMAEVRDVKPLSHNKYFLVRGTCLGDSSGACPVVWIGTYYRRFHGSPAKTWTVRQEGLHVHGSAEQGSGRVFWPAHEAAAQNYVKTHPKTSTMELLSHLRTEAVIDVDKLPDNKMVSAWLKNTKTRMKRQKCGEKSLPGSAMAVEVQARSLDEWLSREPASRHSLVIEKVPAPILRSSLCIVFGCHGMAETMQRYQSNRVVCAVDVKQQCMRYGHGVATLSLIGKDRLRNTHIPSYNGMRIQGRAFTSHGNPILQAAVSSEAHENMEQLFLTAERVWARVNPGRPPLRDCMVQVHKDYAPGIEIARRTRFPRSRPVNDYFHLTEKRKVIESKLTQTELRDGGFVKKELGWIMASFDTLRHLASLDLYSSLHGGFLERLHMKLEPVVAEYLGPDGNAIYTIRATVAELRQTYGVRALEPRQNAVLLFSPHWSGIGGIIVGTDCGDGPQEGMHSPWQKQLDVIGKDAQGTEVLQVMDTLYETWDTQLGWSSASPIYLYPPGADNSLLNGATLERGGRSSAMSMWKASSERPVHEVFEISETVQIVAVVQSLSVTLERDNAMRGAKLLFAYGDELTSLLLQGGLLQDMSGPAGVRRCTQMAKVNDHFVRLCYVCVSKGEAFPFPAMPSPVCTCMVCSRYASCEHIEYVKMLDLRLRAATSFPEAIPLQRAVGRKRGTTRRKARRAAPKAKAKGRAGVRKNVKSKEAGTAKKQSKLPWG